MVEYLTYEQIVESHDEFVKEEGTGAGILNASALASYVEMPQMAVFAEECYKTIPQSCRLQLLQVSIDSA